MATAMTLLVLVVGCSAVRIPASLRGHLQHQLATALSASTDAAPGALPVQSIASDIVDRLVEHVPARQNAAAWAQTSGMQLARLLSSNATAGNELSTGRLSVPDALATAEEHHRKSVEMFEAVQVHHAALRQTVQTHGNAGAWECATADEAALQRYGEAALDVGRRQWARRGIAWCTAVARGHAQGAQARGA